MNNHVVTGSRDVLNHLSDYIKLAESGTVIQIVDKRGAERKHRAYIVGSLQLANGQDHAAVTEANEVASNA
jgi:hypothetical protein